MNKKVILDFCGGTASWSAPYKNAGYEVHNITLPEFDLLDTLLGNQYLGFRGRGPTSKILNIRYDEIHGILAAPPCTMFSFARTKAKKPRDIKEGMRLVRMCLDIIWRVQEHQQPTNLKTTTLKWWALENPYHGLLRHLIGSPVYTFDPYEFGDGYKKRTALWGNFKPPKKTHHSLTPRSNWSSKKFDRLKTKEIHPKFYGILNRTERRAITPPGFAKAFFKANP